MATTRTPLLSLTARGSVANAITAYPARRRSIITPHHYPSGTPTALQAELRTAFASAGFCWQQCQSSAPYRNAWNSFARSESRYLSGYNAFLSEIAPYLQADPHMIVPNASQSVRDTRVLFSLVWADTGEAGNTPQDFYYAESPTVSRLTPQVLARRFYGHPCTYPIPPTADPWYVSLFANGRIVNPPLYTPTQWPAVSDPIAWGHTIPDVVGALSYAGDWAGYPWYGNDIETSFYFYSTGLSKYVVSDSPPYWPSPQWIKSSTPLTSVNGFYSPLYANTGIIEVAPNNTPPSVWP
jgi:hypothetical protein